MLELAEQVDKLSQFQNKQSLMISYLVNTIQTLSIDKSGFTISASDCSQFSEVKPSPKSAFQPRYSKVDQYDESSVPDELEHNSKTEIEASFCMQI